MGTAAYMAPELSNLKKYAIDFSRNSADLELVRGHLLSLAWVVHLVATTRHD